MKKRSLMIACLVFGLFAMASCRDDKNEIDNPQGSAGESFRCIEQLIEGCETIANEVGETKIGDPYSRYMNGDINGALYAVESWYSWHSRDDYSNNILSIRNAYYGSRDGKVATQSLAALIAQHNSNLDKEMKEGIATAYNAILAIPQPFRNNINSNEAKLAMQACEDLESTLGKLKSYIERTAAINQDDVLGPIVAHYTDVVVLPTYRELKEKNEALYQAAQAFNRAPSDATFKAACNAWLTAREPWETSEAFLFGPVDALGLDPNMDSWPLDQAAIVNILNSGNFENLTWTDGDADDKIEAVQGVRGFHTLEFLLFKDGQPRTVNGGTSTDPASLDYTPANAKSWGNYLVQVGYLLQKDAADLYHAWTVSYNGGDSYAKLFKEFRID